MDDSEPRPRAGGLVARPLDDLSVEELEVYAEELSREQERVAEEIARKRTYRAGLDSFFKS